MARKKSTSTTNTSDSPLNLEFHERLEQKLKIPYEIVKKDGPSLVPSLVSSGIYRIKTPIDFSLNVGKSMILQMGIKIRLFPTIFLSSDQTPSENQLECKKATLYAHIDSIFSLVMNHGLIVVGPHVLSAENSNDQELVLCIQNVGNKLVSIKAGAEIAELYFSLAPNVVLNLCS